MRITPEAQKPEASQGKATVLSVRNLEKGYGAQHILNRLSLTVLEGERVAIMGPSGSGKSTLLNCIAGLERPDAGTIEVLGSELGALSEAHIADLRRRAVSSIFQFFHLLPTLSARENVGFPLMLQRRHPEEIASRVHTLAGEVGLENKLNALPSQLSGGEMQRLAIARALITEPQILLADEPTGSLDSRNSAIILQLLQELTERHGTALIVVTHDPDAAAVCQRTLHMQDGVLTS